MTEQQPRAAKPFFPEGTKPWLSLDNSERLKVVDAYLNLDWSVIPVGADHGGAHQSSSTCRGGRGR